jgi:hypothetical protein
VGKNVRAQNVDWIGLGSVLQGVIDYLRERGSDHGEEMIRKKAIRYSSQGRIRSLMDKKSRGTNQRRLVQTHM